MSDPKPETTDVTQREPVPQNDREFAVWEAGRRQGHRESQRAFLRYIQRDNGCALTGESCRTEQQCGCWLERESSYRR